MSSKIASLILEKGKEIVLQTVPSLLKLSEELKADALTELLGADALESSTTCPSSDKLKELIEIRNNLVDKLNSVAKTIETLSKPLSTLPPILDTTNKGLNIAQTAVKVAEVALIAIPPSVPIPFSVLNTYIKADKLINITLPPIITQTTNKINALSIALDYANNLFLKLLNLINKIDAKLTYCKAEGLNPLNSYLNNLSLISSNLSITDLSEEKNVYKGFILEIVEEPYTPTVNRRKAVAKNSQDIILLETPLSFTTDNQILIDQIKLIIDSDNLKAY